MKLFPGKREKWHFRALKCKNILWGVGGMPPELSAALRRRFQRCVLPEKCTTPLSCITLSTFFQSVSTHNCFKLYKSNEHERSLSHFKHHRELPKEQGWRRLTCIANNELEKFRLNFSRCARKPLHSSFKTKEVRNSLVSVQRQVACVAAGRGQLSSIICLRRRLAQS